MSQLRINFVLLKIGCLIRGHAKRDVNNSNIFNVINNLIYFVDLDQHLDRPSTLFWVGIYIGKKRRKKLVVSGGCRTQNSRQ